ncbi:MAG: translation initiation factor IF-2 subunit alpha [Candidatus Asgardarchaeia archaeon]
MRSSKKRYPEEGELVIATVTNIKPYGAYVTLDEYDNLEGMVHISEISTTWVKNIRNHVREGQKIVAKVLRVIPEKNQIDLSIRRVTKQQKVLKIQSWKRMQKAKKILELVAERLGKKKEEAEKVYWLLQRKYEETYSSFEMALEKGKKVFLDAGLDEDWAKELYEIIKTQVKIPKVEISGTITLQTTAPNGVDLIKEALSEALKISKKVPGTTTKIYTLGAPNYKVEVVAKEYRDAENLLKEITTFIESYSKENNIAYSFKREK